MFNGKSILVTGGTGSFGKAFIARILKDYPEIERLVVFSRDELKQFDMSQVFSHEKYKAIRYFIGDVRDVERLKMAFEGIDTVIHAAALKQVVAAEYNPMEFIKTNILGAENVVNAALATGVKNVVALSTDKACAPINLYGATKLCSDKLFVAGNNISGDRDLKISVVRYGNVLGSRGSVVPYFLKQRKNGKLTVTHNEMTRFSLTLESAVDLVLMAHEQHWGGEIFIPKIPSYRITDLIEAVAPGMEVEEIGIRPGEKLHEEMITEMDALNTLEFRNHYVITPATPKWELKDMLSKLDCKKVDYGFKYNSGINTDWLTVSQMRQQIREHVDPTFELK